MSTVGVRRKKRKCLNRRESRGTVSASCLPAGLGLRPDLLSKEQSSINLVVSHYLPSSIFLRRLLETVSPRFPWHWLHHFPSLLWGWHWHLLHRKTGMRNVWWWPEPSCWWEGALPFLQGKPHCVLSTLSPSSQLSSRLRSWQLKCIVANESGRKGISSCRNVLSWQSFM